MRKSTAHGLYMVMQNPKSLPAGSFHKHTALSKDNDMLGLKIQC